NPHIAVTTRLERIPIAGLRAGPPVRPHILDVISAARHSHLPMPGNQRFVTLQRMYVEFAIEIDAPHNDRRLLVAGNLNPAGADETARIALVELILVDPDLGEATARRANR